jgi:peptidyl-prolyl cis-trans isomerase A (cyclophilin A)
MINIKRIGYCMLLLWLGPTQLAAQVPDASILTRKAPEKFKAVFKTTKGQFIIEAYRNWSPLGVDRLYQLITSGYYSNTLLFRVEPDYVVQFGVAETNRLNRFWDPKKIPDEPVRQQNTRGTIAFARDLKNTRCAQLFVNMANNRKLDTIMRNGVEGFVPVARVVQGMIIISSFNAAYKKRPMMIQDSLYKYGNAYFEKKFPGLDRIISARILP